ncbi:MAG: GntR family transcriptional regulator [Peptoniphilus harei]|uniref:GntR family transcriptional regulator n=1 Tax=uncultured Peptoniphilus sp. TaxID=254354 RepID=UPI001D2E4FB6|nr:GntR family transcriptional regulator [uncultured Peptoniphilus sp.]MBS4881578.1 GntR family transcriptional regulator [Peptoniphilus harei]MBS5945648.1 GntR family transcriptional regulator [Peptoniphilus harei]MDU5467204.1 GntR family transcriptional regulator [Peptoniphilus harei]MDU5570062.1 GntR family transcriptional regulator [Peptoniphilus harei]MDU6784221.1 GntR family transcriptional regulator [Peptoniphilus harei]
MKIILINGSAIPLYEQIKNAIKENILKNKVEEGEQLPSVRTLSKDLKVSILTVKKAYDELEEEGFVESRQGLGTFVAGKDSEVKREELQKKLEEHLQEAINLSIQLNLDKKTILELFEILYKEGLDYDE